MDFAILNQGYGPYEAFNPYIIFLMMALILGISLLSYVAIRFLGPRKGIGLTGFLAGLISSTALVLSFSGQSKNNKKIVNPYVFAVVIASSAMFFRILVEVFVLNKELLEKLVIPMGVMGGVGLIAAVVLWGKKDKDVLKMKNPLCLWPVLKFGVFFAAIMFLAKFMQEVLGDRGLYLTSLVSGIMDVDAITVSVANLAKNGLESSVAVNAIVIAAMMNTIVKGGMFLFLGNRKVALRILMIFAIMLVFGGISLLFI
jgi:uncharacterized membrane protein (DUF4010 family)